MKPTWLMLLTLAALTACVRSPRGVVQIDERQEAPAPGLADVRIQVGDVLGGSKSDVVVKTTAGVELASGVLTTAVPLEFVHAGHQYQLSAVSFHDACMLCDEHDSATVRIDDLGPVTHAAVDLRIGQYQLRDLPDLGIRISIDDIRRGEHAQIAVVGMDGSFLATADARVGEPLAFQVAAHHYQLTVQRYEDHILETDLAFVRISGLD